MSSERWSQRAEKTTIVNDDELMILDSETVVAADKNKRIKVGLLNTSEWKEPCLRATTGNITTTGNVSVDGSNTVPGDRILVKNQNAPSTNGIYIADALAWSRALDMNTTGQFSSATVWVQEGNTNADTQWYQTEDDIIVDTSVVIFIKSNSTKNAFLDDDQIFTGENTFNKLSSDDLETPFGGFGEFQNFIRFSEKLDESPWQLINGITTALSTTEAPNGTLTAFEVDWAPASSNLGLRQTMLGIVDNNDYTVSFWAKHISGGTGILRLDLNDGIASAQIPIDSSSFRRYSVNLTAGGTNFLDFVNLDSSGLFLIWGVQVVDGFDNALPYTHTEQDQILRDFGGTVFEHFRVGGVPQNTKDATNKKYTSTQSGYVDNDGARVATTGNINLSSSSDPSPIDGITLATDDRILLKNQNDPTENGIYDIIDVDDPNVWERSEDSDDIDKLNKSSVSVAEGNTNADKVFLQTKVLVTLNSDDVTYEEPDAIGKVGTGLKTTGVTLSVDETEPGRLVNFDDTRAYDVRDLVIQDNLTYRNINAVAASGGTDFDIDDWLPVGGVGAKNTKHLFSEADLPPAAAVDGISGDVHTLEDGIEYILANDITLTNGMFVDVGADVQISAFSPHKNKFKSTTNIIMLQSQASIRDFDSAVGGVLESVTVTSSSLYEQPSENVTLEGQMSGAINAAATITVGGGGVITSVNISDGGSGYINGEDIEIVGGTSGESNAVATGATDPNAIVFESIDTSKLAVGKPVNIKSDTGSDYTQLMANISTIVPSTSFTIDSAIPFDADSTGTFDLNAKSVELERVIFQNELGFGTVFVLGLTRATTSEFMMLHCELDGFDVLGLVADAESVVITLSEFEKVSSIMRFIDCKSILFQGNFWSETGSGAFSLIEIQGGLTENVVIANNSFLSPSTGFALQILGSGGNTIDTGRVVVESNIDLKSTSTTLFSDATNTIDELDERIIVKNNPTQEDSKAILQSNLPGNHIVLISLIDDYTPVTTASWTTGVINRFDENNGTFGYTGLRSLGAQVMVSIQMYSSSANEELEAALFSEPSGGGGFSLIDATEFKLTGSSEGDPKVLTFAMVLPFINGFKLQLQIKNNDSSNNITINNANISILD